MVENTDSKDRVVIDYLTDNTFGKKQRRRMVFTDTDLRREKWVGGDWELEAIHPIGGVQAVSAPTYEL